MFPLYRPKSEEIIANTRNIEANFLDSKKMEMANVLLTEFAEEHKKYVDRPKICLDRVRATPLAAAVGR